MRVLMLAPQPFFAVRGTPIALHNLLKALEEADVVEEITLLTLPFGQDRFYKKVHIRRLDKILFTAAPKPGFSATKFLYDLNLLEETFKELKERDYSLIHAVEEASFIAMVAKKIFKIPYVYDMDSLLSLQLSSGIKGRFLARPAVFFERKALREAMAVIAVCPVLAEEAKKYNSNVFLLEDTPYNQNFPEREAIEDFRKKMGWKGKFIFLYTGNFQPYQGVELLVEAFSRTSRAEFLLALVGEGGERFENKDSRIKAYGQVAPEEVNLWLASADVLVSPRIEGTNTPMKIYSYLAAGKPIIATDIISHTQILNEKVALLVPPEVEAWTKAMERIHVDLNLKHRLSLNARKYFDDNFAWEIYKNKVIKIYKEIRNFLEKN